ncbi:flagellar filament capping protein FliD [Metabacillus halosaccharovorans]|uniref:flagellar filament capping protein FliD n=1 Tax=Metabacillus halosaccharovorans TaxID=930124 RepID=UPI003735CBB4
MAIRIGGLASGMDIDTLVSDLMKAERIPLDNLTKKKTTLEWQRDNYREVNTLLLSLRNETFNMRLSSAFSSKSVTTSNEARVTATAANSAGASTYNISRAVLATSAKNMSSSGISADSSNKVDVNASIYSIRNSFDQGSDSLNNFNWKSTGGAAGGVDESIKVTKAGSEFTLQKLSGGTIEAVNSVKVGSTNYTVTTNEADKANLTSNQVYVDVKTGKMTFGSEVAANSTIEVNYKYVQKDTLTAGEGQTKFTLSSNAKAIDTAENLTISVTNYQKDTQGNILKDSNGNPLIKSNSSYTLSYDSTSGKYKDANGKVEMDISTGEVNFTAGLEKGAKLDASYSYQYFEMNFTTNTSSGVKNEVIKVNGGESFNQMLNKINSANLGLSAFYDEFSDKVVLSRTETGNFNDVKYDTDGVTVLDNGSEIKFSGNPFLENVLKLSEANESGGTDAEITINGLETKRHSNSFAINGVTFNLKETFTDGSSVQIGVTNNNDNTFEKVKAFIEKYNETIGKINEKLSEERYRDYKPLTDEEREAMSDTQVELWEERAKSGLLRRDSMLQSGLTQLRMNFYSTVSGAAVNTDFNQLSEIGITTSPNYLDGGKLVIDEDKLKKALETDPVAVEKLFTQRSDVESEKGLAFRLYDTLDALMERVTEKAGSAISTSNSSFTMGKQLNDLDDQISSFQDRLTQIEERYWRQFSAMETAIQKSNSQMSYLMQQFSM